MPGLIPPPSPPPRAQWEGQNAIPANPLIITPGQGLTARTDATGKRLLLDATRSDAVEVFGLFAPGAVAARTLGVWGNQRPSRSAICTRLEANLLTPPTAGDASNYWRVRLADGVGGAMVLPISSAGVGHYMLDQGSGAEIFQGNSPGNGVTQTSSGVHGVSIPIRTTAQMVVTGVKIQTGWGFVFGTSGEFGAGIGGVPMRASILDAAGNRLASAVIKSAAANTMKMMYFAFPVSLTLAALTTYHVALDVFDAADNYGDASQGFFCGNSSNYVASGPATIQPGSVPGRVILGTSGSPQWRASNPGAAVDSAGAPFDWPAALAGKVPYRTSNSGTLAAGQNIADSTTNAGGQAWFLRMAWSIIGSGGGTVLTGDVTASLESTGAPAAGAAGADLNLRAVFLP